MRTGNTIRVAGTTASSLVPSIPIIGGSSVRSQTVAVLDNIEHALKKVRSTLKDVVCTRVTIRNKQDREAVAEVHCWVFRCLGIKPAAILIIAGLVGDGPLIEIEAEAEVRSGDNRILSLSDLI